MTDDAVSSASRNFGGQGRRWVVELTDKEFAELKDGDRVAIGIGIGNLAYLGRLNKSMPDR